MIAYYISVCTDRTLSHAANILVALRRYYSYWKVEIMRPEKKIHTILEGTQTRELRFTFVWMRYKIGSLIIIFMFEDAIMVS